MNKPRQYPTEHRNQDIRDVSVAAGDRLLMPFQSKHRQREGKATRNRNHKTFACRYHEPGKIGHCQERPDIAENVRQSDNVDHLITERYPIERLCFPCGCVGHWRQLRHHEAAKYQEAGNTSRGMRAQSK